MEDDFKNAKLMMTILMVRFSGLPGSMDLRSNLELNQSERPCTRELVQVCLAVGSNWDMMGTPSGEEVRMSYLLAEVIIFLVGVGPLLLRLQTVW